MKLNEFELGSRVWYFYPRRFTKKSPKWQQNYTGPYEVIRVIPPVNYVLRRTPKSKPFVVHADKLKKCYAQSSETEAVAAEKSSPVEPDCGDTPADRVHQRKRQVHSPRRFLD